MIKNMADRERGQNPENFRQECRAIATGTGMMAAMAAVIPITILTGENHFMSQAAAYATAGLGALASAGLAGLTHETLRMMGRGDE